MRRYHRLHRLGMLLASALLIAACGSNSQPSSSTVMPAPSASEAMTGTTVSQAGSTEIATSTVIATDRPTASTTEAAATSAPTSAGRYAALPQSKTPEGYYVLGRPDAPVVMTHYSDFL